MSLFSFSNLKKSSVYITPNFPTLDTKRYKIRFFSLVGYFAIFLLILILLLSLLFTYTPLNKIIMYLEDEKIVLQTEKIAQLEQKVSILSNELNRISYIDKRLNYALALGRTDSLDSTAAIYDSLRKTNGNYIKKGGSILFVFDKLMEKLFSDSLFFIKPINSVVGRGFNPENGHLGVDFLVKDGSPIHAPADGTIIFANYTIENGNEIIIQHKNNYLSIFKHCSIILKKVRQDVVQGEIIALSGNTGTNTSGSHLHFEIWKNSKPINPEELFIN